ncbi:MAG: glycosyltransferase family 2 protein [Planctomycetes bacterium]|nr:glycosyltransferase family 2 protein [Planctomycetota bacterium]
MTGPRVCALIPTYDNPRTVRDVVLAVRRHLPDVIVVDDGSGPEGRAACEALARDGLAAVHRLAKNSGKGGAVKAGFDVAAERGFTHAFQVDADGQHDLACMPAFVAAAADRPDALILGFPVYDATAPKTRMTARRVTKFWVDLEVGRDRVHDAMIGCRVYPIEAARRSGTRGNRMDFDVEVVVRMARSGVPIVNLPVNVRYLTAEEGGVSHFHPVRDIVRLSWMHSRVCTGISMRWVFGRLLGGAR